MVDDIPELNADADITQSGLADGNVISGVGTISEVMDILGIGQGEKVGEILKQLHEKQVNKDVTTKTEAQEFVRKQGK